MSFQQPDRPFTFETGFKKENDSYMLSPQHLLLGLVLIAALSAQWWLVAIGVPMLAFFYYLSRQPEGQRDV